MPKSIPDGYHTITPNLVVQGCDKAIEFYKKAFGAKEHGRLVSPDGARVVHAEMQVGDSMFMLGEDMPDLAGGKKRDPKTLGASPVTIHLYVEDADAAIERAEEAGAKVTMPAADMFWGDRYGRVTDPFGHDWSFGTHVRDVSLEEMEKGMEAFAEKH